MCIPTSPPRPGGSRGAGPRPRRVESQGAGPFRRGLGRRAPGRTRRRCGERGRARCQKGGMQPASAAEASTRFRLKVPTDFESGRKKT